MLWMPEEGMPMMESPGFINEPFMIFSPVHHSHGESGYVVIVGTHHIGMFGRLSATRLHRDILQPSAIPFTMSTRTSWRSLPQEI